jgi:anti-sigma B factor antagonist
VQLRCSQQGDVMSVEVAGSTLDAECADEFRDQLEASIATSRKVLLDLGAVVFADSTGLGAILGCLHRAAACGRTFRICNLRPLVQEMFHVLRLDRLVEVHATPEEALRAFGAPQPA